MHLHMALLSHQAAAGARSSHAGVALPPNTSPLPQDLPSPAKMHEVAAAWRPYASLGSYFMWKVDAPRAGSGGSSKKRKAK